jgi:hypothetical protein
MEKPRKIQRGLKDVSHLFLSSLEGGEGRMALRDISPAQQQQFLKRCKFRASFVLQPALERQELAFHSMLTTYCEEEFERVWMILDSPTELVWNEFQARYNLPSYQEVKEAQCRIYPITAKKSLVVVGDEFFKQLSGYGRIREREVLTPIQPELFWFVLSKKSPQSFPDFVPFLDELMFVTSPHVEEFSEAYKMIKACLFMTPDLSFSILLNAKTKSIEEKTKLRERFDQEFNRISTKFLHMRVPVVGPVDSDALLQATPGSVDFQDWFSFYRVQNWKRWQEKMVFSSRLFDFVAESQR